MPSRTIKNEAQLEAYIRTLRTLKLPFTAEHQPGVNRSGQQNRLMWQWAGEFAAHMGDRTADETQRDWKLRHGVPILRSESASFCTFYDARVKPASYEDKLEAMEFLPVSRIMTVAQMGAFMNAIQREATAQGVRLTDPELLKYESDDNLAT